MHSRLRTSPLFVALGIYGLAGCASHALESPAARVGAGRGTAPILPLITRQVARLEPPTRGGLGSRRVQLADELEGAPAQSLPASSRTRELTK